MIPDSYLLAILFAVIYACAGVAVMVWMDTNDRVDDMVRHWSDARSLAMLAIWPLTVAWLAWRLRRHG